MEINNITEMMVDKEKKDDLDNNINNLNNNSSKFSNKISSNNYVNTSSDMDKYIKESYNNSYFTSAENYKTTYKFDFQGKKKQILIWIIAVFAIVIAEIFFREPLFNFSVTFEDSIQSTFKTSSSVYTLARLVSHIPKEELMIFSFLIIYNYCNLLKTFAFLILITWNLFAVGLLKIVYHNPRPIWMSDKMVNLSCEGGFGNPSGHSFGVVVFLLSLYETLINQNKFFIIDDSSNSLSTLTTDINSLNINKYKKLIKTCVFVIIVIFIFLVGFSRIILGVHSINQVIYGFILGYLSFYFIYKIWIPDLNNYDQLLSHISDKAFFIKSIAVVLFVLFSSLLVYYIDENDYYASKFNNKINSLCPDIPNYKRLYNESLLAILLSTSTIGAILGINLEYNITLNKNNYNWIKYNFGINLQIDLNKINLPLNNKYSNNNPNSSQDFNDSSNKNFNNNQNNNNNEDPSLIKNHHTQNNTDHNKEDAQLITITNNDSCNKEELKTECKSGNDNQNNQHDNNSCCKKQNKDLLIQLKEEGYMWSYTTHKKTLYRFIILICACLIIGIPALIIPRSANLIIIFLVKFTIPATLIQIYLFYFHKRLCEVFSLNNKKSGVILH